MALCHTQYVEKSTTDDDGNDEKKKITHKSDTRRRSLPPYTHENRNTRIEFYPFNRVEIVRNAYYIVDILLVPILHSIFRR